MVEFLELTGAIAIGMYIGRVAEDVTIVVLQKREQKKVHQKQAVAYEQLANRLGAILDAEQNDEEVNAE